MNRERQLRCAHVLAAISVFLILLLTNKFVTAQSQQPHGSISGMVTTDNGIVRGFRVKARDTVHKVTYTVFTNAGKYSVPELTPGSYEVRVLEDGFQSPVQKLNLGAGENKAGVDLALKKVAPPAGPPGGDFDKLYPPGPGRDLLAKTCMGCHGLDFYNTQHRNEAGWRAAIYKMTNGPFFNYAPALGRSNLSKADKDLLVQYLTKNFGPDNPGGPLIGDEFVRDEAALSKAIFVEYDAPADMPYIATKTQQLIDGRLSYSFGPRLHDPYVGPDDNIWFGSSGANGEVRLDQREIDPVKRWTFYPINSKDVPNVFVHGNATDSKGRVYWAEIIGGKLGELDPETGKTTRYDIPAQGSMLQVVVDKDDNVWYADVHGSNFGKLDAKERKIYNWSSITPDASLYGLAAAPDGTIWAAGYAKHLVLKFDPVTEKITEYVTPTIPSGVRRLGVDSKGIVWFSEFAAGQIGSLDPKTGKITEYKLPLRYSHPYETWPDKDDNIWVTSHFYGSLIHYDRSNNKWTYYPLPQGTHWSVPKVEIDRDNTVWFGSRGVPNIVGVHFYPDGYTAAQKPRF